MQNNDELKNMPVSLVERTDLFWAEKKSVSASGGLVIHEAEALLALYSVLCWDVRFLCTQFNPLNSVYSCWSY
jgi:hypothetical protein